MKELSSEDTHAYVNHRLRRAALGAPLEFSRDVTDLVHLHSRGIPRKINVIADAVLLFGYGEEQRAITVDLAHNVIEELEATGVIDTSSTTAEAVAPSPAVTTSDPDIAAREQRLQQRERQLAEQQRILLEEYRLARLLRVDTAPAASPAAHAWGPAPPPPSPSQAPPPSPIQAPAAPRPVAAAPRPVAAAAVARPPAAARYISITTPPSPAAPRREATVWTRLRGFFGASPVFED